ncbi:MAG: Hpt domain-containing protein [Rhizobiaceae bacterium]|nr:Hpt domain-containing protein [Rhizobiaceae bacterium]
MTHFDDSRSALIDEAHLDRQTMGDARLAAELLGMFVLQLDAASQEIADASPQRRIALAHSLKGTARSLGIGPVADCAVALESQSAPEPETLERMAHLALLLRDEVDRRNAQPG